MRRWTIRTLSAAALGLSLAAAAPAQQPMPPAEPVPTPVAPPVTPPPPPIPPAPIIAADPYAAATPYNPTTVGRPVPNPHYNRANFTIPCAYPNQNLAPLEPYPRDFGGKFLHYTGGKGYGCANGCGGSGCGNGCGNGGLGWLKHKSCCGDGGGSCATCQNTCDFVWGSSRTFFGESSREFFERPPSVDGLKNPHKVAKYGSYVIDP